MKFASEFWILSFCPHALSCPPIKPMSSCVPLAGGAAGREESLRETKRRGGASASLQCPESNPAPAQQTVANDGPHAGSQHRLTGLRTIGFDK